MPSARTPPIHLYANTPGPSEPWRPAAADAVPTPSESLKMLDAARAAVVRRLDPATVGRLMNTVLSQADTGDARMALAVLGLLQQQTQVVVRQATAVGVGRSEETLRKLAADYLHVNGASSGVSLSHLLEVSLDGVSGLFGHDWFEVRGGQFALSPAGRRQGTGG